MKTLLILCLLIGNYCFGQTPNFDSIKKENDNYYFYRGYTKDIDSLPIINLNKVPLDTITELQYYRYQMTDSVWINKDTTYFIFRYYKKQRH